MLLQTLTGRPAPADPAVSHRVATMSPPVRTHGGSCGWFDSSHELLSGLGIVEHVGFDAVSDHVPLGWQLAAWCA